MLLELEFVLLEMTLLSLGHVLSLSIHETELNGVITIVLSGLLLRNNAGAALNDGNGDYVALLVKDLSHTDFLTDKSLVHCVFPPVNYWLAGGTQSRSDIRVST